nr:putative integron gene cassette protein [uncultured bacterium]
MGTCEETQMSESKTSGANDAHAVGEMDLILNVLTSLKSDIDENQSAVNKLSDIGSSLEALRQDIVHGISPQVETIDALREDVTLLTHVTRDWDNKLERLRELLLDDPETVVTIPLIKKDIQNLRSEVVSLRSQLEWAGTYTRWSLGVLFSLALAVIGLALSIYFKT